MLADRKGHVNSFIPQNKQTRIVKKKNMNKADKFPLNRKQGR